MSAISSAEDFHTAVTATTEKPLVVCFSAPWCGGCKMVAPKVATLAKELTASATFITVSAEELNALCEELEVNSFPHFRVYKEEKIVGDYTSSKFDKVDAFIRGLVAPNTLHGTEDTPEDEDKPEEAGTKKTEVAEVEDGSKKRQERDDVELNDSHIVKKAKTDTTAVGDANKEKIPVGPEEAEKDAVKMHEVAKTVTEKAAETAEEAAGTVEVASELTGKKLEEEEAPVDKIVAATSDAAEA